MLIAVWLLTAVALALWSLLAWGMHKLLSTDPHSIGDPQGWLEALPFAAWLDLWFPDWHAMLRLTLDLLRSTLAWANDAFPWIVAAVWGLGAACLIGMAVLASLLIVWLRPKPPALPAPAA